MITPIILHGRTDLLPAFVKLLRDSEAEVRVAAAAKVSSFSKLLVPQQIVPHIVPCVRELAVDGSQYVRAALAGVVMELAPMLGKQVHIHRWTYNDALDLTACRSVGIIRMSC